MYLRDQCLVLCCFLIYVNDICNVSSTCSIKLFADDTNVFVFGKCADDVFKSANTVVSQLNSWFIANKLSLNVDKTCYSVFGQSGANVNNNILKVNSNLLSEVSSCRYLGLMIYYRLTWKTHIEYVYSKLQVKSSQVAFNSL